jgi:hypothetical protein
MENLSIRASLAVYYLQKMREYVGLSEKSRKSANLRREAVVDQVRDEIRRGIRTTLGGNSETIVDQVVISDTNRRMLVSDSTYFAGLATMYANAAQAELKYLEYHDRSTAGADRI